MDEVDTIIAPATPSGEAALAVIRVSGPHTGTIEINALRLSDRQPRRARLATYTALNGAVLDQLVATAYQQPASYTGEDMLELSCHGNPLIVRKIIDDLIQRGCRLADPGEFTRRAFLNGKLDLTQAEAVVDMIRARSDQALDAARRQLAGSLVRAIDEMVAQLLGITAHLEAYIDFPEEDLPPEDNTGPALDLVRLIENIAQVIDNQRYTDLLKEGVRCVILGEPNAGKSSLLNAMTGEDRAIVAPSPGTTRDYLEERIRLGPYLLRIIDTAGLHETMDAIESQGIDRTIQQIENADLLLIVLDATRPSPTLPEKVNNLLKRQKAVVIENKQDLPDRQSHHHFLPDSPHVSLSAKQKTGIDNLRHILQTKLEDDLIVPDKDAVLVSSRHASALRKALEEMTIARSKLQQNDAPELVAAHLHHAIAAMNELTGGVDNESMLDALFHSFCIGK